ncbi:hypothetical protein IRT45_32140 [Nocardia sp. BSTN01]|uniref:hypothetical protein n=1 Tax=Nocardia sp. BSTN01 TaxID=2783665 RepID=UPI00188DE2B4|nr:hypothetical protein [Nocardia sp. BSTN01]MBF5001781.1 hypothetical protein [Nocardia sp. BSTN01]
MTSDCTPLITPDDCKDAYTTPVPAPMSPAPGSSAPFGNLHPQSPPGTPASVQHVTDRVDHHITGLHLPNVSAVEHVVANSLVAGVVVVAMLILIIGVASALPLAPHRLRNFAFGSLVLPVLSVLAGGSWSTPASLLWSGAGQVAAGDFSGVRLMLSLGVPVAMLAATYWWASFVLKTNTVGLKSLARTERMQEALTARRARAAVRAAKLGAPYSAGANIVLGTLADRTDIKTPGLMRELTARHQHWMTVPHKDIKRHQAIIATTGGGKTELIKRHALATFEYEWRAWYRWKDVPKMAAKHPKPQLVLITCKGGQDDLEFGREIARLATAMGVPANEIATVVPGGDRLHIWDMPARDQRAVLGEFLCSGEASTSEGQHFDDLRKRVISLVVDAPIGEPGSHVEFLERLNEHKLKEIWSNAPDVVRQVNALQAEKVPQIDDALIKCSNLFDLLKDDSGNVVFDGGRNIDELSVLFMTVPGLDKDAARSQVAATLRMVMQRAGRKRKDQRRSVTLYLDEASALTTKQGSLGLEEIAERGRSQGVAMVFAGQSPESLAADKWSLDRLLKACAGGVLIGYGENFGELCKHFGSRRVMLPSRHLIKGQRHGDEGQVSVGEKWLVDPDRVRQFETGDFVFAKKGRAFYGRIVPLDTKRLTPLPGTDAAKKTATQPGIGGAATAAA